MTNIDPIRPREWELEESSVPVVRGPKTATAEPSVDDRILYLSMNTGSAKAELAALGPNAFDVGHSAKNDTIDWKGRTYDLSNLRDAMDFAAALGVSSDVGFVISSARDNSRDELARIALAWSPAERGGAAPSRLVLSGHSQGDKFYGDGAELDLSSVRALARAMPRAAACIEDIHLAGCNTAKNGTADHAALRAIFPNLRTFWAYQGSSPIAPVDHLQTWETQTRGRANALHPTKKQIEDGVTIVDRDGHADGKFIRMPKAELDARLADANVWFVHFDKGWQQTGPDPYKTRLYDDYQSFQAVLARPDYSEADKAKCGAFAEKALRLRYYDVGVRVHFQEENAKDVQRTLGPDVDISKLTRKEALAKIDEFLTRPSSKTDPFTRKLVALRDLDPDVIKTSWCVH